MIEITQVTRTSTAPGAAFFDRWCDLPTHPEWAPSMEYFELDGPFAVGARGRSRAVGGEETRFTVTRVGPGWVYADATDLGDTILTVLHEAVDGDDGTVVTLTGLVEGDRAQQVAAELADGLERALERDLASLILMLESAPPPRADG